MLFVPSLHVIYRSTGRENAKPRPAFYSKKLALVSFIRSLESCPTPPDVLFANDGPIGDDLAKLMAAAGELVPLENVGLVQSLWAAFGLALARGWSHDDVVYFAEDDYLFLPGAVAALQEVVAQTPEIPFYAFYAAMDGQAPHGGPTSSALPAWLACPPIPSSGYERIVDGLRWCRAESTTSSFAARLEGLRVDRWVVRLAHRAGRPVDHPGWLTWQGRTSYRWSHLVRLLFRDGDRSAERRIKLTAWRTLLNLVSLAYRFRPRILLAPESALATHLELPFLARGVDWGAQAKDTAEWAAQRGIELGPP